MPFFTILCHWKEKCVEKVSLFVQKNICLGEKNKAVKIFEDIASRNSKENAYFVWVVWEGTLGGLGLKSWWGDSTVALVGTGLPPAEQPPHRNHWNQPGGLEPTRGLLGTTGIPTHCKWQAQVLLLGVDLGGGGSCVGDKFRSTL